MKRRKGGRTLKPEDNAKVQRKALNLEKAKRREGEEAKRKSLKLEEAKRRRGGEAKKRKTVKTFIARR